MEKKFLAILKKSNKIFALFQKMIARLTKHNDSLQGIIDEARTEIEKHQFIVYNAATAMNVNKEQIAKIETFIGVGKDDTNVKQETQSSTTIEPEKTNL